MSDEAMQWAYAARVGDADAKMTLVWLAHTATGFIAPPADLAAMAVFLELDASAIRHNLRLLEVRGWIAVREGAIDLKRSQPINGARR